MFISQVGCPVYIVHANSKGAAQAISRGKERGHVVFGEAIAAALGCDGRQYWHKCWRHAAGTFVGYTLRCGLDWIPGSVDRAAALSL